MKKAILFLPILAVIIALQACGDSESSASSDAATNGNNSNNSGKITATITSDSISTDAIWGQWRAVNKPGVMWEFGKSGLSIYQTEEVQRTEDFEITQENRCTEKKVDGKTYLVVKGAVITCYGLRRLSQDSLFLDLLPFRPPLKFVKIK